MMKEKELIYIINKISNDYIFVNRKQYSNFKKYYQIAHNTHFPFITCQLICLVLLVILICCWLYAVGLFAW